MVFAESISACLYIVLIANKAIQHPPVAKEIEFDDLETLEHTKRKPLLVTLAVEYKTRRILCFCMSLFVLCITLLYLPIIITTI